MPEARGRTAHSDDHSPGYPGRVRLVGVFGGPFLDNQGNDHPNETYATLITTDVLDWIQQTVLQMNNQLGYGTYNVYQLGDYQPPAACNHAPGF